MNIHLQKKFPEHISLIRERLQDDETFAEICADYEEVCTWFAGLTSKEKISAEENSVTQDLIRELEGEILATIGKTTK